MIRGLKGFTHGYFTAALWSSVDNDGTPLDDGRDVSDIAPGARARMEKDCAAFYENWHPLWDEAPDGADYSVDERAGHDFWLTRNGHGAGFWDRPEVYGEENARRLTDASKASGSCDLIVGDDDLVYTL